MDLTWELEGAAMHSPLLKGFSVALAINSTVVRDPGLTARSVCTTYQCKCQRPQNGASQF